MSNNDTTARLLTSMVALALTENPTWTPERALVAAVNHMVGEVEKAERFDAMMADLAAHR